jgi:hypothetical protein
LVNNDGTPPNTGRVTIVDFVGQVTQDYLEHYGDSNLFNGWTDAGDLALAGDFLGYGHDQLLLVNNDGTPPNTGRVTIVDFVGQVTQDYLEHYGDSNLFNGWTVARWTGTTAPTSTTTRSRLLCLPY